MKINSCFFLFFLGCFFFLTGCEAEKPVLLSGKTMGTTWHLIVMGKNTPDNLSQLIEKRLEEINQSMSMFQKGSELSEFNNKVGGNEKFCVSNDFIFVYRISKHLYQLTGGAWDGTIGPLVNLWGFGNEKGSVLVADKKRIEEKLKIVGFNKIKLTGGNCLVKEEAELVLDFGSIAKGYGVDAVADLLKKNGINNFLLEIGGEVYASGTKLGKNWRVGIKTPEFVSAPGKIFNAIELKNMAIATSGDYRNFREIDGVLYSHVISPKTGMPVNNKVASVSVLAENTTFADGLATAIMVMGQTKGLELVNSLVGIECLIVVRNAEDGFTTHFSTGWGLSQVTNDQFRW